MRLFISYARVDKPFCIQIVDMLEVHETWYDQRLYAGNIWWKEILYRLDWCEGFVYLLSHDSVASPYCIKEFELAYSRGLPIFPVLIQEDVQLPEALAEIQYVDFTQGATTDAVRMLLNSIYKVENQRALTQHATSHMRTVEHMPAAEAEPPIMNSAAVIGHAAEAMENGQFDKAVYLLRQAKQNDFQSKFINLDLLLAEAEQGLARQMYLREAAREYKHISDLMKYRRTRKLGCNAFKAFQEVFPDYDPDNLARTCEEFSGPRRFLPSVINRASSSTLPQIPLLEWMPIPAGNLILNGGRQGEHQTRQVYLESYAISKYPVTNEQYQLFLESPKGYADPRWWAFSEHAMQWRRENPTPAAPQYKGAERPRETVSWYDAMAYANWLSKHLGFPVRLPTILEWMRAARGDDERVYPWGDVFAKEHANTKESQLRQTSQVTSYPSGASPFDVMDLSGNIWEWCLNGEHDVNNGLNVREDVHRAVHGGSHIGPDYRAQISFRYYLQPRLQFGTVGFRLVRARK